MASVVGGSEAMAVRLNSLSQPYTNNNNNKTEVVNNKNLKWLDQDSISKI